MVVNLPLTMEADNVQPDKDGFYACAYVMDDMMLSHSVSDPSGQCCKLVLGAPLSMVADRAKCLRPKRITYNLTGLHLENAGMPGIAGKHIQGMIDEAAKDTAVPAWDDRKWKECVFDNYIPCSIQYEDAGAMELMHHEDYSCMTFTHGSAKGNIKLEAQPERGILSVKEYVSSILSVLHDGAAPSITEVHAKRVLRVPPYTGMDMSSLGKMLKTFDHRKANAAIEGRLKGLVRVARISTQMGCITTMCIAKKTDLQQICEVLTAWAKPIVAAQQMKAQIGLQWRAKLEGLSAAA